MTYEQLKAFCNSLTDEQLKQEVYLSQTDDAAIKIESAIVTEQDEYFDHCDALGTLEMIKEENPSDWEDVIADASTCPKGTVMLLNE
jgi:hypothetical protein